MVYTQRTMSDGNLYTAGVGQFLTVNLRAHTPSGSSLEHAGRLVGGEETLVAEHVDKVGQLLAAHLGNHLFCNKVYVFSLSARIGTSHGMGTQKSGNNFQWGGFLDATDDAQHLQFVLGVQSVATLYFNGSRPLTDDLVDAHHGAFEEFVLTQLMQAVGTVQDASAATGYLGIAEPLNFVDELVLTALGIDEVGVGVAERRQHQPATGIDDATVGGEGRGIVGRTPVLEASVFDEQPRIFFLFQMAHLLTAETWLAPRVGDERPDILYEQLFHCTISPRCPAACRAPDSSPSA